MAPQSWNQPGSIRFNEINLDKDAKLTEKEQERWTKNLLA